MNRNGVNELLLLQTEEDRPTFRPFTRESLAQIEARIQEEEEKKRELEKKRQEGEVRQKGPEWQKKMRSLWSARINSWTMFNLT